LRNEIQNWIFKDSIENFKGLIEFIEGLVTRKKMSFEINLSFN
jgi:hypothetical protein